MADYTGGAGKYTVELFDPEFVALQVELMTGYHPKLEKILGGITDPDVDMRIAQIAAYCEVMLDDVYTIQDRARLCGILRDKLLLKRENPNSSIIIVQ